MNEPKNIAVVLLSAVLSIVAAIILINWLDNYIWEWVALLAGVAAGFLLYGLLRTELTKKTSGR